MTALFRPTPVFCCALGAAIGFYFLSFFSNILFVFLLIILSLYNSFFLFYQKAAKIDLRFRLGRSLRLVSVCIMVFVIGIVIGKSASYAGQAKVNFALLPEKIIAIEGVLAEDPRITSSGSAMAAISLERCASHTTGGMIRATASGEITVFFPEWGAEKLRDFGRGTKVFSEGTLRKSPMSEGEWVFSASSMHITEIAPPLEQMRTRMRVNLINRFDGKDWGGLSLALLLGIKDNLDSDLASSYRNAGCSFILALSGMHLAVLAAIIAFLLRKPLGLKLASVTGALLICLYCFLVGPMPSLNRAALMYIIGVIAVLGFLPKQPLSILSLSFLIQIIITPSAGHSISFMLSYLALAGIFIIGQPLYEIFSGKVPDFLMQPLSASCGAFIATSGITGSSFGYLAPIGIIIGLVLVPITTLYMILSLLWLVLDFISVSGFLSVPLFFIYRVMETIVSFAAKVPAFKISSAAGITTVAIVISLAIIIFEYLQRKNRLRLDSFL